MNTKEVYNWYIKNGEFDDDLISKMQLECFNKPIQPAAVIDYHQLQQLMSQDKRFSDKRIIMNWLWIFDGYYAAIDENLLLDLLDAIKDVHNEWTVVAIIQSVTGLNCGFVWSGRAIENGEITKKEVFGHGYLVSSNGQLKLMCFNRRNEEVKEGEVVIGLVVFD